MACSTLFAHNKYGLAVEVLSRSSRIYNREFKRDAYFALGAKQAWPIDRRAKCIEVAVA
jgi:Uma2 family endonuclease